MVGNCVGSRGEAKGTDKPALAIPWLLGMLFGRQFSLPFPAEAILDFYLLLFDL